MRRTSATLRLPISALAVVLAVLACGKPQGSETLSQRLVDVFDPAMLSGSSPPAELPPPAEWRFADTADTLGWEVFEGVEGLAVRDGRLVGRATQRQPILRAIRPAEDAGTDVLYEIRVRLKVSPLGPPQGTVPVSPLAPPKGTVPANAGANLALHFVGGEPGPFDRVSGEQIFWAAETPIVADGEMHSYTLGTTFPILSSRVHEVYLRPTDAAGATFEIESIRLVFQRELLAEKTSGVGWHGLDGGYRETVTARAPESIRWEVVLPERPRFTLGLGTLDVEPLTFRLAVATATGEEVLAERTLATPDRWEDVAFDLDAYAGEKVTLRLSLHGKDGTPGLWGAPAVRRRIDPEAAWGGQAQGVLLLVTDTLRPDRLGFYGHERPTTPRLDELARTGTVFRDAHSHAPWTRVAMPALITSLHPLSHNLRAFNERLPSSAVTLAEIYRDAGWATAGFSAVPHTGRSANMHQGYESLREGAVTDRYFSKTARGFVDHLLPWLERHRDERFFVFFHVFDPHFPYEPRPPFDTLWNDPARRAEHQDQMMRLMPAVADPLKGKQGMASRAEIEGAGVDPEPYLEIRRSWYDASIRAMDEDFGRIFERLRELDLDRRVLVAFTSDHGEEFLEHDWMGHGHSLFGELIHVPLLLWRPGLVPAGVEIDEPVQHLDVLPTLLELSGLPVPEQAQGQSLLPLLAAAADGWRSRPVVSERPANPHPMTPPPREFGSVSLIFDGWKLIHHGEGRGDRPKYELYDHRADPRDTRDLAAEEPEVVARLAGLLDAWRRDAEARKLASDADLGESLSQEELERLRSLGYVQ